MEHLRTRRLQDQLFHSYADSDEREKTFGLGNVDIDRKFDRISHALADLALTNRIDRDTFRDGEETLASIIAGMRERVQSGRKGINPAVAEEDTLALRTLGNLYHGMTLDNAADHALRKPVTPNEIDDRQQESLAAYSFRQETLKILIELHRTVHTINEMLDREPPGRGSAR